MILLTMDDFIKYVEQKMNERRWSQADLAREANMTTSMVSNLLNGKRKVGIGTANSLSKAFRVPATEVLAVSGLIPKVPQVTAREEQLLFMFRRMTEDQQDDVIKYSDFLLSK